MGQEGVIWMETNRAALYCRVDGGGGREMYQRALSAQRGKLEAFAREHGLEPVRYYEDAGYSGSDLTRPGLNQMLVDWKEGKFDMVLVIKRTRLYRGSFWNEPKWPFPILSANQLERTPYYEQKR